MISNGPHANHTRNAKSARNEKNPREKSRPPDNISSRMMTLFFEMVLAVALTSSETPIAPDGIASTPNGGILGRIQACCGPQEPQGRGSLRPHTSKFPLNADYQRLLLTFEGRAENPDVLNAAARKWVNATTAKVTSIQLDDISESAPCFAVGQGRPSIDDNNQIRHNGAIFPRHADPDALPKTNNPPTNTFQFNRNNEPPQDSKKKPSPVCAPETATTHTTKPETTARKW